MVYCRACGLFMTNGICMHGSVEAYLAREAVAEKRKDKKGRKGY